MSSDASLFRIEVVSVDQVRQIHRQWEDLSAGAVESNPFFEPWMLLPALKGLGCESEALFALVWRSYPTDVKAEPLLTGLFPFKIDQRLKGLPVSVVEVLTHIYSRSGVPLLLREFARPSLEAYFDWLASSESDESLVYFQSLPADGLFHHLLIDVLYSRKLFFFLEQRYTRALYKHPENPFEYIDAQFSGKSQKHLRRQKELLREKGTFEARKLEARDDITDWAESFLRLEALGWKGKSGTALSSVESHAAFFREATQAAHKRNRLNMSGLFLGEQMIAGRTEFRAGDGSYLFKIAFDEAYAKHSPGTLLEIECIQNGVKGDAVWVDSCTSADNRVYKRIWMHRRTIEDLIVSAGSLRGDFIISALPFLRFAKSLLRRIKAKLVPSRADGSTKE